MGYAQEREKLHKYIDQADDNMIHLIHALVEADMDNKHKDFERKLIDQGLKSLKEGKGIPHEQVMRNARLKFPNLFK